MHLYRLRIGISLCNVFMLEARVEMSGKVKEVQDYLKTKGIIVAETSIVDMAIDIAERLGPGRFVFASEAIWRKKKGKKDAGEAAEETAEEKEISDPIRDRVLQDIGRASMCWEKTEGAGVFDTTRAIEIGDSLCQFIADQIREAKKES
jgi:hypothetical protein